LKQLHITVKQDTKKMLDELGQFKETYNDIIKRLIIENCCSGQVTNPVPFSYLQKNPYNKSFVSVLKKIKEPEVGASHDHIKDDYS